MSLQYHTIKYAYKYLFNPNPTESYKILQKLSKTCRMWCYTQSPYILSIATERLV